MSSAAPAVTTPPTAAPAPAPLPAQPDLAVVEDASGDAAGGDPGMIGVPTFVIGSIALGLAQCVQPSSLAVRTGRPRPLRHRVPS